MTFVRQALKKFWLGPTLLLEVPIPIRGGAFNWAAAALQIQYRVVDEFAERPRVVLQAESMNALRKSHSELSAFVEALVDDLSEDDASSLAFLIESPEGSVDSRSTGRLSMDFLEYDPLASPAWDARSNSPVSEYSYEL